MNGKRTMSASQLSGLCARLEEAFLATGETMSRFLDAPLQLNPELACTVVSGREAGFEVPCSKEAGVGIELSGDLAGQLVLLISHPSCHWITARLIGPGQSDELTALARSALQEVGNILVSSFLTELENRFGVTSRLHPPRFNQGASQDLFHFFFPAPLSEAVVIKGGFCSADQQARFRVFLLLDLPQALILT
ncbi:chemotaxis protein CheC [Pelobacter seleniigenes]|uniref:chemotaxis protein CheC n=1 Tax=Pelobacter seleniigenes TaxID=407188 RepID=UPI0004A7489A|nr:chemotaxis protein CheC [Pelobacter seleniigenes]